MPKSSEQEILGTVAAATDVASVAEKNDRYIKEL